MIVATYNVLAQSTVGYLYAKDPVHLSWEHREPLLRSTVRDLIEICHVVALQEVSPGAMAALVEQAAASVGNTHLVRGPFTAKGLANWLVVRETEDVRVEASGFESVGDNIPVPADLTPSEERTYATARKQRHLPWARLTFSDHDILVAGYHMPLELNDPLAMQLHATAMLEKLALCAKGAAGTVLLADPLKLAGLLPELCLRSCIA